VSGRSHHETLLQVLETALKGVSKALSPLNGYLKMAFWKALKGFQKVFHLPFKCLCWRLNGQQKAIKWALKVFCMPFNGYYQSFTRPCLFETFVNGLQVPGGP
jgi:hypothetical protein